MTAHWTLRRHWRLLSKKNETVLCKWRSHNTWIVSIAIQNHKMTNEESVLQKAQHSAVPERMPEYGRRLKRACLRPASPRLSANSNYPAGVHPSVCVCVVLRPPSIDHHRQWHAIAGHRRPMHACTHTSEYSVLSLALSSIRPIWNFLVVRISLAKGTSGTAEFTI